MSGHTAPMVEVYFCIILKKVDILRSGIYNKREESRWYTDENFVGRR